MDEAGAQYRSTVLTAFQQVADSLYALKSDADALNAQEQAASAASDALKIARNNLQLGSVNGLVVLSAEQSYQQAAINLVQARTQRYADTVALYQALGGQAWPDP
jgi:outer membrane protein TolC